MRLGAVKVVVPDADQGQEDGEVVLQLCVLEVLVHFVPALQELVEIFISDGNGDGETDGGPEGVSTADPVPEWEHVRRIDAEFLDCFRVRGERHEMLGDVLDLKDDPIISDLAHKRGVQGGHRPTSLAFSRNQSLADVAFVIVSWVVNVLLATMKRVVSGSETLRASARCVPSMLLTKRDWMDRSE